MYLCADTDTFSQNVSVPIQIQYQYFWQVSDTDTKFGNFPVIFCQFWSNTNGIRWFLQKKDLVKLIFIQRGPQNAIWFSKKLKLYWILVKNWSKTSQKVSKKVLAAEFVLILFQYIYKKCIYVPILIHFKSIWYRYSIRY